MLITEDHWPTNAGSVTAFDTVTVTAVEVVRLPAASRATAARVCVPFAAVVLSQVSA